MTSYIRFTPLSGAKNESPPCYLLELDDAKILLDCGWNEEFDEESLQLLRRHAKYIDYVLLTHNDIRHVGALPYAVAKLGINCPIYATLPVQALGRLTLHDVLLSEREHREFDLFSRADIEAAFNRITTLTYMQPYSLSGKINGTTIIAYAAGHTVGGTIWKIKKDTDDIVYAVNFNHRTERHLSASMLFANSQIYDPLSRPSLLITDCYNADNGHATKKLRDQALTTSVIETLRNGGNVLLPSDTTSRVLELSYIMEQYWAEHRVAYPIVLLSHTSNRVIYQAKSMLEWFGENLTRAFSNSREYPFDFKYIKIISKESDLQNYPSPKVVIASTPSLEYGFAHALFMDWCLSPKNTVILTQRGESGATKPSLARTLTETFGAATSATKLEDNGLKKEVSTKSDVPSAIHLPDLVIPLIVKKRVPLEGTELEEYLDRTRLQAAAEAHQAALVAKNKSILEKDLLDEDEDIDDDDDNDNDDKTMLSTMVHDPSDGLAVLAADVERVLTTSHDVYVRGNSVVGGLLKSNQRVCMFPFNETRRHFDDYGEAVKADMFLTEADKREREREAKKRQEKHDEGDMIDTFMTIETDTIPPKYIAVDTMLPVRCQIQYIDFEGLSDGRSLRNIIPLIQPRKMILVHGSEVATERMKNDLQNGMAADIMTPAVGESLNVSAATNIFQVKLSDDLFSTLPICKYGDYEISLVSARVTIAVDGDTPLLDLLSHSEMKRPLSLIVGSVRLSEFKRVLDNIPNLQTAFVHGLLVVNGKVGVRKTDSGQLMLEGSACREYYQVRELLYKQHAVL